jgi:hypothetical protein
MCVSMLMPTCLSKAKLSTMIAILGLCVRVRMRVRRAGGRVDGRVGGGLSVYYPYPTPGSFIKPSMVSGTSLFNCVTGKTTVIASTA